MLMVVDKAISQSISAAILHSEHPRQRSSLTRLLSCIVAFFALFRLRFTRIRNDTFQRLRNETWDIDIDVYKRSFAGEDSLQTVGEMGYSGLVNPYSIVDGGCLADRLNSPSLRLQMEIPGQVSTSPIRVPVL